MVPRVNAGDTLRTQPLNKAVDAINTILSGPGLGPAIGVQAGTKIFVINKTGRDMLHGEVAPISINTAYPFDPPAMPYDNPQRMLQGTVIALREPISTDDWTNWVVMGQKIPDGRSGWAYDSGILLARVKAVLPDDLAINYHCCDLLVDQSASGFQEDWWHLERIQIGPARILWIGDDEAAAGSGEDSFCWALIRLGGHDQYPQLYEITDGSVDDYVKAKRVMPDGSWVGDKEEFYVLPDD